MREKKLTNVRNTGSEEKVSLSPPRLFTLEDAIGRLHHRVDVTLVAIQKVFCAVSSSLLDCGAEQYDAQLKSTVCRRVCSRR